MPAAAGNHRHGKREAGSGMMQQNRLYLIIGALVVVVIALGVYIWQEERKPDGVEIKLDENGISIEQN
jgi:uncharacterized iron-regulated membrane protein